MSGLWAREVASLRILLMIDESLVIMYLISSGIEFS